MRPYAWQGPFIPVLPNMMMVRISRVLVDNKPLQDCLEAPVPCVIGVTHIPDSLEGRMESLIVRLTSSLACSHPDLDRSGPRDCHAASAGATAASASANSAQQTSADARFDVVRCFP
jgi:hypothetical protein